MNTVSQAIVRLFEKERFYAEVIIQMHRIENPKLPSVAGVCVKDQIELHINTELFSELKYDGKIDEPVGILRHECEHILRNHIPRMRELAPEAYKKSEDFAGDIIGMMKHKCLNISADCAINSHTKDIPKWGVFPKNFDLKNGETLEWYLENLKDNDKAKNFMNFDEHSLWSESDKNEEVLKEKVRQVVNKAAVRTRAAGLMTANDELIVQDFNHGHTVSWKDQLKQFVAKCWSTKIETSRKKRNRRYGIMYPGVVKTEELNLGFIIDTSGSMSDEALIQGIREVCNIAKYARVTAVEADAEVKDSYIFDPKKTYTVKGRGGTAYQPAFDLFNEDKEIDGVIYFGDMDCSDTPNKPKYPVLWAIVGEQNPPVEWGRTVRVKV